MVRQRHGLVTIGVAIQAETFSSPSSSPTPAGFTPTSTTTSKSAIFLPPNKDGAPQTLKITFSYNKETNLPEVVVNFDEGGEEKYLKLKELIAGGGGTSTENQIKAFNSQKGKDLQVYYFENMENDNQGTTQTQIIEVPAIMPKIEISPEDDDIDCKNKESKTNKDTEYSTGNLQTSAEQQPESLTENSEASENIKDFNSSRPSTDETSGKKKGSKKMVVINDKKDDEKVTSPKNNNSSKSSSKMNGRSIKRKSKSRSIEKQLSPSPERNISSPTKGMNDRSKIPIINSAAVTGVIMPCEYYRQKWLQEVGCTEHPGTWTNYSSIQKTAGQKVVNKLNEQQKKLEESAAAQKKRTEFVFHDELGFCEVPQISIPIRKKQTRLEPLRTIAIS